MNTSHKTKSRHVVGPLTAAAIAAATIAVGFGAAAPANAAPKTPTPIVVHTQTKPITAPKKPKPVDPTYNQKPATQTVIHNGMGFNNWIPGTPLPWQTVVVCAHNSGCANPANDY